MWDLDKEKSIKEFVDIKELIFCFRKKIFFKKNSFLDFEFM